MCGRGAFSFATAAHAAPSGGRLGASHTGAMRNADVGISNDNRNENFRHRKSKVS